METTTHLLVQITDSEPSGQSGVLKVGERDEIEEGVDLE